jgi:two-component system response regulator TtrR
MIMAKTAPLVYVVDDDEPVRASLKLLIESCGYHTVTFKSAEDFLDSNFGKSPCCLILDIHLPGMSGFNLQKHLVKSQTPIPVIFITGHDRYRMEDEAIGLGAIAYLRKPFDEQDLLDAIRLACEKGKEGDRDAEAAPAKRAQTSTSTARSSGSNFTGSTT